MISPQRTQTNTGSSSLFQNYNFHFVMVNCQADHTTEIPRLVNSGRKESTKIREMGTPTRSLCLLAMLCVAIVALAQWKKTPLEVPAQPNPHLYREDANASAEINQALVTAM